MIKYKVGHIVDEADERLRSLRAWKAVEIARNINLGCILSKTSKGKQGIQRKQERVESQDEGKVDGAGEDCGWLARRWLVEDGLVCDQRGASARGIS